MILAHHVLLSRQPLKKGETFDLSEKEKISMESRASEFEIPRVCKLWLWKI
jgi:hypothetical protein